MTNKLNLIFSGFSFSIAFVCLILLLSGCAGGKRSTIAQDLQAYEKPFSEWVEEIRPPDPMQPVGFKEPTEWSAWNKFWFGAAVGGQVADVWSTKDGLDRGCREANPLYGDDPSVGAMVAAKIVVLGVQYAVIEYLIEPEKREPARNIIYGASAIFGFGIAARNFNLDCQ